MNILRRIMQRRRAKSAGVVRQTYVAEVEWHRNEELRPEWLGPGEDDITEPEPVVDPWRPKRTLGPMPKG